MENTNNIPPGWKEVTKDEFYAAMTGDVHPTIEGKYPYWGFFQTPGRIKRGLYVGYYPENSGLAENKYYLP